MKIGELTLSKKIIFFSPILLNTFFLIYLAIKIGTGFLLIHDSPLFVTSIDAFKTFGYFWLDNNFGSINFLSFSLSFFPQAISYALFTIGLPIQLIQIIFYFFILNGIFYTSFISFYKSLELIRMRSEPSFFIPSLIGAFFYTYNLYMIASWHGGTVDGLFLLYMSAPLVMYLFLQILIKEFTLFHTLLLALCIALCINTFPFALALYLILFTILLLVKKQFFLIKNIRLLILLVIVSIGMSFFFLVPIFLTFLIGDPFPLLDGGQAYVFSNYGLQGMFRFYFDWTINQNWGGRYFHSYFPYYNNILIALSAFLLWFMIFKTYWNKFNSRAKEASTFLISGVVLSLFFAKGIQAPFGEINLFFYRYVPLFNIFRTPDTKFGLPVVLFFSLLLALAFLSIKNKYLKWFCAILVLVQIIVFFSAIPIIEYNATGSYDRIINVPSAYTQIASIVNKDKREGRILMYPGVSYGTYSFSKDDGITGQDVLGKLINRPIVYNDNFVLGKSEQFYRNLISSFIPESLGKVGIRYILIRTGVNNIAIERKLSQLKHDNRYKIIYESSLGTLFLIDDIYYHSLYDYKTKNDTLIHLEKINPTKYIVSLKGIAKDDTLTFLSSFHSGWHLYPLHKNSLQCSSGKINNNDGLTIVEDMSYVLKKPLFDNTHTLANSFGNQWQIKLDILKKSSQDQNNCSIINRDGSIDTKFLLYFTPQAFIPITFLISMISIFGVLGILYWKRK